jgi:cell division protein FtsB
MSDPQAVQSAGIRELARPADSRGRRMLRYTLLFVTIVLIADALVGEKGLLALMEARREFRAVDLALQRAREDNAALREDARRLREDPSAIEALARRDLGLIKPGELLFIVKDIQQKD